MSDINLLVYTYLEESDLDPGPKVVKNVVKGMTHLSKWSDPSEKDKASRPDPEFLPFRIPGYIYKSISKGTSDALEDMSSSKTKSFDFKDFKFDPNHPSPAALKFIKDNNLDPKIMNTPGFKSLFFNHLQTQSSDTSPISPMEHLAQWKLDSEEKTEQIKKLSKVAQEVISKTTAVENKLAQANFAVVDAKNKINDWNITINKNLQDIPKIVENAGKEGKKEAKILADDANNTLTKIIKDPKEALNYLEQFYDAHKPLIMALGIVSGMGMVYKLLKGKPKQTVNYSPSRIQYNNWNNY